MKIQSVFKNAEKRRLILRIEAMDDIEASSGCIKPDLTSVSFYDASSSSKHSYIACASEIADIIEHELDWSTSLGQQDCIRMYEHFEAIGLNQERKQGGIQSNAEYIETLKLKGDAFVKSGKRTKAAACYTLALRANPALDEVRGALEHMLVSASWNAGEGNDDDNGEDHYGITQTDVGDIEDLLQRYTHVPDTTGHLDFQCSHCGECCRSRDHISLSPFDIYNISRCPTVSMHQLMPTMRIFRHPTFESALVMGKDAGGYPNCELRPKLASLGQCHFSYPLFTNSRVSSGRRELMDLEEVEEYISMAVERDRLTEEFEEGRGGEGEEEGDMWRLCEEEFEERYEDVLPVMNATGKPALGCMLGKVSMPTVCSAYPLVPERELFGNTATLQDAVLQNQIAAMGDGVLAPNMASLIPVQPKVEVRTEDDPFVLVQAHGCEGFLRSPSGAEKVAVVPSDGETSQGISVEKYLQEGNLGVKWQEMRWFEKLRNAISSYLPCDPDTMRYPGILRHYQDLVRRIWFDFDCLARTRRPIKTYARLKIEIETASWTVARVTKVFVQNLSATSSEHQAVESYVDIIKRTDIIKC